jgi:hypothetical protein
MTPAAECATAPATVTEVRSFVWLTPEDHYEMPANYARIHFRRSSFEQPVLITDHEKVLKTIYERGPNPFASPRPSWNKVSTSSGLVSFVERAFDPDRRLPFSPDVYWNDEVYTPDPNLVSKGVQSKRKSESARRAGSGWKKPVGQYKYVDRIGVTHNMFRSNIVGEVPFLGIESLKDKPPLCVLTPRPTTRLEPEEFPIVANQYIAGNSVRRKNTKRLRTGAVIQKFRDPKFDGFPWMVDDLQATFDPAIEKRPTSFGNDYRHWVRSQARHESDPNKPKDMVRKSEQPSLVSTVLSVTAARQGFSGGAYLGRLLQRCHLFTPYSSSRSPQSASTEALELPLHQEMFVLQSELFAIKSTAVVQKQNDLDEVRERLWNSFGARLRRSEPKWGTVFQRPDFHFVDGLTTPYRVKRACDLKQWDEILEEFFDRTAYVEEARERSAEFKEWVEEARALKEDPDFKDWYEHLFDNYARISNAYAATDRASALLNAENLAFTGQTILQKPRKHKAEIVDGITFKLKQSYVENNSDCTDLGVTFDQEGADTSSFEYTDEGEEIDGDTPEIQNVIGDERAPNRSVSKQRRLTTLRKTEPKKYMLEIINMKRASEIMDISGDALRKRIDRAELNADDFDFDGAPLLIKMQIAFNGGLWVELPAKQGAKKKYMPLYLGAAQGTDRSRAVDAAIMEFRYGKFSTGAALSAAFGVPHDSTPPSKPLKPLPKVGFEDQLARDAAPRYKFRDFGPPYPNAKDLFLSTD